MISGRVGSLHPSWGLDFWWSDFSQVEQWVSASVSDWGMVTGRVRDQKRLGRGQELGRGWLAGSLTGLFPVSMVSARAGSLCPSLRLVQRKQENAGLRIRLGDEEMVRESGSLADKQAVYLNFPHSACFLRKHAFWWKIQINLQASQHFPLKECFSNV